MTTPKTRKTSEKPIEILPINPFVFEVLELASKQRSNDKKVEVLKTYEHDSLKSIFIWNFDESVISLLPEGPVPYADAKDQNVYSGNLSDNLMKEAAGGESATHQDLAGNGKTSLRREYRNLYHYVKGGNNNLSTIRRETMFINLLQGLHPKEAEVLILTKDKKLSNKYKISIDNVKESYPDITWGGRS
jgi:hypothetical protein